MASQMLGEIEEQPTALRRLLSEGWPEIERVAEAIRARKVNYAQMVGRGSSDNAARYGQYTFGALNGLVVGLAAPSLYTMYDASLRLDGALVIGLSQSGRSPDVAEVVRSARARGALTLAITNYQDSPLAQVAEHSIWIRVGEERSIPATKTYTAQLLALAMLNAALAGQTQLATDLQAAPEAVAEALHRQPQIAKAAEDCRGVERMLVIGRGFNFATAHEIALKLQESAYVAALPFSSADFRHGPLSLVEPALPALVFAPSGRVQGELLALGRDLRNWGAKVIVFGDASLAEMTSVNRCISLPGSVPEWLSPLPLAVMGQLFALALAGLKGLDPDRPRRLHKVTATL